MGVVLSKFIWLKRPHNREVSLWNLIKTNESDLRKAEKEVEGFLFIFFGFEEFES